MEVVGCVGRVFNNCKQALEVVLLHDRPGMPHISLSLTLIRLSTTNDTEVTTCFYIDRNINQTELVGLVYCLKSGSPTHSGLADIVLS